jgi:hypothetical protein
MHIDAYSFGKITIDGRLYAADLILYPDRVEEGWWRGEGHRLAPEDLSKVLRDPPDILLVGTGASGCMAVPETTAAKFREKGIEVRAMRTAEAVAEFNRLQGKGKKVAAALHLTC